MIKFGNDCFVKGESFPIPDCGKSVINAIPGIRDGDPPTGTTGSTIVNCIQNSFNSNDANFDPVIEDNWLLRKEREESALREMGMSKIYVPEVIINGQLYRVSLCCNFVNPWVGESGGGVYQGGYLCRLREVYPRDM